MGRNPGGAKSMYAACLTCKVGTCTSTSNGQTWLSDQPQKENLKVSESLLCGPDLSLAVMLVLGFNNRTQQQHLSCCLLYLSCCLLWWGGPARILVWRIVDSGWSGYKTRASSQSRTTDNSTWIYTEVLYILILRLLFYLLSLHRFHIRHIYPKVIHSPNPMIDHSTNKYIRHIEVVHIPISHQHSTHRDSEGKITPTR